MTKILRNSKKDKKSKTLSKEKLQKVSGGTSARLRKRDKLGGLDDPSTPGE